MESGNRPLTCQHCGRVLPDSKEVGRPRRFCDATCRSAARRDRIRGGGHGSTEALDVQEALTGSVRHVNLDIVPNETDGEPPAASVAAGREAVRDLLAQVHASPLGAIAFVRGVESEIDAGLQAAVQRAREAGHTWAEIGQVLGSSRQAAFQRFARPADPRTGVPMANSVLPGAADRSLVLIANLATGRWADARRDFGENVAQKLDADGLAAAWARLAGQIGRLEHTGKPVVYQAGDLTVADIPLSFEAGERTARIAFDCQGKIAGLHFLPPSLT
jgi:hypothetical protein